VPFFPSGSAAVAAIVKITFLTNYGKHGDFLYDSSDITIWTTVEICTAIMAANIPCLKPLFKTLFDGTSVAQRYGSNYKGYIRNNDSKHRTNTHGGSQTGEFELYDRTNFTSDVRAGGLSSTGSEESILKGTRLDGITKTTDVFVSTESEHGDNIRPL
jgi:hypothetical protein